MSFKDNLKEKLTPKNTEEIKTGLFIQERNKDEYRMINPIVWNGKYRLRKQFRWRNLFMIIVIIFIVWSYSTEVKWCRDFQAGPCEILSNLTTYCYQKQTAELENGRGDTFNIQNNP